MEMVGKEKDELLKMLRVLRVKLAQVRRLGDMLHPATVNTDVLRIGMATTVCSSHVCLHTCVHLQDIMRTQAERELRQDRSLFMLTSPESKVTMLRDDPIYGEPPPVLFLSICLLMRFCSPHIAAWAMTGRPLIAPLRLQRIG